MKPKDLKAAFSWEERRPLIQDRIFHVPAYYADHAEFSFPGWESDQIFGNAHPVAIEFCAGNGAWICEKAKKHPEKNWVAVEMRYDRVRKIWSKLHNERLSNLFVISGEALTFTHNYVPESSIEEVYINFPDPWPKEKHEKHRLMKSPFIAELQRILKEGRRVTFVSDDRPYIDATIQNFLDNPTFRPIFEEPYFITDQEGYGTSWFEDLWREKGRSIHSTQFELC